MYHSAYSPSVVLGNQIQQKLPVLMTYGDVPLVALDPLAASLRHLPPVYAPPVILDISSMKRLPLNLLMHNVEAVNCYMPVWPKRDASWTIPERHFSKDNSTDSGNASDGGASTSRSSTPSSVEAASPEITGSKGKPTVKHIRRTTDSSSLPYVPTIRQKHSPFSQRHSTLVNPSIFTSQRCITEQWVEVSKAIWNHYVQNRQPEEMYFRKMRLRYMIQNVLNESFTNCGLWVVGSSVNGLGTNTSDMDMCLVLTETEIDQQTEAMLLLKCVQNILHNKCSFIKSTELITAKVPILKFTDKLDIQVDLNINNTVGIANTVLIRDYCCMDWRVQPLVLVIKKWAQDCNINNAKDMTLSSYSLTLMVIHYLQCGCDPYVLPCLQKMRPKKYMADNCVTWQDSHYELPPFKSKNKECLGELLYGFFNYFSNVFNFDKDVMSVRLGCKIPKYMAMNYRSAKNKRGHWKYICIEEPFNRTNTACAVYDGDSFTRILISFRSTWMKLKIHQDISAVLKL